MIAPPLPSPDFPVALGSRALFPDLEHAVYLNHAAISPASSLVRASVELVMADYARRGIGAFGDWLAQKERLRAALGALLGTAMENVALTAGTTRGVLDLAFCMPWRAGDRVLCFAGEFPANVTPWQMAAETFGASVELLSLDGFGDGTGDGLARVEAALARGGVRVVAVSAVQFQSGLRMPLAALATLAHAHGARLFVDAIQACGVCPLDLDADGVDYLVSGGHKWMMGLEGAGFAAIAPEAMAELVPRMAGWLSVERSVDFLLEGPDLLRYDKPVRQSPTFLEGGAYNTVGLAALEAGFEPIRQLGVDPIFAHVTAYLDALEAGLLARGFRSARPAPLDARSGILSVRPPGGADVLALAAALATRGVSCATPDGWLRAAPHWPNALDEVPHVLDAVDDALASLPHR